MMSIFGHMVGLIKHPEKHKSCVQKRHSFIKDYTKSKLLNDNVPMLMTTRGIALEFHLQC